MLRVVVDQQALTTAMLDAGVLPEPLLDNRHAVQEVLEHIIAEWAHSVTRDFPSRARSLTLSKLQDERGAPLA